MLLLLQKLKNVVEALWYQLSGTWGRSKQTLRMICIQSLFSNRPLNSGDMFVFFFYLLFFPPSFIEVESVCYADKVVSVL